MRFTQSQGLGSSSTDPRRPLIKCATPRALPHQHPASALGAHKAISSQVFSGLRLEGQGLEILHLICLMEKTSCSSLQYRACVAGAWYEVTEYGVRITEHNTTHIRAAYVLGTTAGNSCTSFRSAPVSGRRPSSSCLHQLSYPCPPTGPQPSPGRTHPGVPASTAPRAQKPRNPGTQHPLHRAFLAPPCRLRPGPAAAPRSTSLPELPLAAHFSSCPCLCYLGRFARWLCLTRPHRPLHEKHMFSISYEPSSHHPLLLLRRLSSSYLDLISS